MYDIGEFLQRLTVNDVSKLDVGDVQYSAMCYADGGIVDDLLVYRFKDKFWLVGNAANLEKDLAEMKDDMNSVHSNLLLLNSSFSGLQVSYKFITETLAEIKKSVEQRNREAKKAENHFLKQVIQVSEKIDYLMEKIENGKRDAAADAGQA